MSKYLFFKWRILKYFVTFVQTPKCFSFLICWTIFSLIRASANCPFFLLQTVQVWTRTSLAASEPELPETFRKSDRISSFYLLEHSEKVTQFQIFIRWNIPKKSQNFKFLFTGTFPKSHRISNFYSLEHSEKVSEFQIFIRWNIPKNSQNYNFSHLIIQKVKEFQIPSNIPKNSQNKIKSYSRIYQYTQ